MKLVSFTLEQGNKYFGQIDGTRFFIGSRVSFEGNKGLMNVTGSQGQRYDRSQFRQKYGFWADFIHPTAMAEGALYHTLNTYDPARFTFSFLQYAAHVPNGDFVLYLRALLRLPLAVEYFPDLQLKSNRVARVTDGGIVELESDASTEALMDYFNPSSSEVEDTEVIQAAKMVHWVQNDPMHRDTQIRIGVEDFKAKMSQYAKQYGLDGQSDTVCLVIADIRHQGRAKSPAIVSALQSANPLDTLLDIGEPKYHDRLVVIRNEIDKLMQDGTFGHRKYNLEKADFV